MATKNTSSSLARFRKHNQIIFLTRPRQTADQRQSQLSIIAETRDQSYLDRCTREMAIDARGNVQKPPVVDLMAYSCQHVSEKVPVSTKPQFVGFHHAAIHFQFIGR